MVGLLGGLLNLEKPSKNGFDSNALVDTIFKKNPGFKKFLNPQDVWFSFGDESKYGFVETFPPDEPGSPTDPRPQGSEGKFAVEFRDKKFKTNPILRENMATLELLHALPYAKEFQPLMTRFSASLTDEQLKEFNLDRNNPRFNELLKRQVIPAFLRGAFNTLPDEKLDDMSGFAKSFRGFKGIASLYTDEQRQIIDELKNRLNSNNAGLINNLKR